MNWSQVIPILLGAVLAVTTTFVTKFFSDWYEIRAKRIQVNRFLTSEMSSCVSRINSLLSIYEQSKIPDPALLVALERATALFAKYREAVYFLDIDKSQQVLEFYDCIEQAVEMILSMLRLAQENKHTDYASKEIQKQMSKLERASSIGQSFVTQIKAKSIEIPSATVNRSLGA